MSRETLLWFSLAALVACDPEVKPADGVDAGANVGGGVGGGAIGGGAGGGLGGENGGGLALVDLGQTNHSRVVVRRGASFVTAQLLPLPPLNSRLPAELLVEVVAEAGAQQQVTLASSDGGILDQRTTFGPASYRVPYPAIGTPTRVDTVQLRLTTGGQTRQRSLVVPVLAIAPPQRALGLNTIAWLDLGALLPGLLARTPVNVNDPNHYENLLRAQLRTMHFLGVRTIVLSYVEYLRLFFYENVLTQPADYLFPPGVPSPPLANDDGGYFPSPWNAAVNFVVQPPPRPLFDPVQVVLDEAERLEMGVIIGLGRDRDEELITVASQTRRSDGGTPAFEQRLARAERLERAKARDFINRFAASEALVGFYISHEAQDLETACAPNGLLGILASALRAEAPSRLIVASSVNNPDQFPPFPGPTSSWAQNLRTSELDVIAWQDSVGEGLDDTTFPSTPRYDPAVRIPQLPALFSQLRGRVDAANAGRVTGRKTLWSVSEIWEMDGTCTARTDRYCGSFPGTANNLALAQSSVVNHVDALSLYEFGAFLEAPSSPGRLTPTAANAALGGTCGTDAGASGFSVRCQDYSRRARDLYRAYAVGLGLDAGP